MNITASTKARLLQEFSELLDYAYSLHRVGDEEADKITIQIATPGAGPDDPGRSITWTTSTEYAGYDATDPEEIAVEPEVPPYDVRADLHDLLDRGIEQGLNVLVFGEGDAPVAGYMALMPCKMEDGKAGILVQVRRDRSDVAAQDAA